MKNRPLAGFFLVLGVLGASLAALVPLFGQPKLILSEMPGYRVGEQIDTDLTLLDSDLAPVRLFETLEAGTKIVVLVIFGGAAAEVPESDFRGPLWCQDSFDDLAIQRALVNAFSDRPVEFVGVAVPPVFSPGKYGYASELFLTAPEQSHEFRSALSTFVDKTTALQRTSLVPFPKLYFDPRMTLLSRAGGDAAGNPAWLGRLKWHLDPRRYGAPTIWILSRTGEVLREPFWGNEYGAVPPEVHYGFSDLESAVSDALKRMQ